MKIDDRVEQLVRDTLHWAVKRKPAEFGDALRAFPDEASRLSALELLVAICGYTTVDLFGQRPSEGQVRALATDIAEGEGWSSVTIAEVADYIDAVLGGSRTLDTLPPERLVPLSFVVAANLLSSKPKAPGEWWFNYLDKVEAAIEAAG
ncbi:hypothetical protein CA850_13565 [Micromonospora echinospora]|nr:hypothetical protein [Micromonospora echinospora]OZV81156.1 hypothetical protein CA850_13565 [Micromonospora echinospora]